jgi:hypothetical protein
VATFKIPENMFEFSQYLGFFTFLNHSYNWVWLMFSSWFRIYWVGGASWEAYKEKRAKKKQEQSV